MYNFQDLIDHFADNPEIKANLAYIRDNDLAFYGDFPSETLSAVLFSCFSWDKSPQEQEYWGEIYHDLAEWEENNPTSA